MSGGKKDTTQDLCSHLYKARLARVLGIGASASHLPIPRTGRGELGHDIYPRDIRAEQNEKLVRGKFSLIQVEGVQMGLDFFAA